ncbi:MAG: hypothetical protein ABSG14_08080 [Verrucomicrobiia bacterium]
MSLRIIVKADQIRNWIEERRGTPARRRNTDTDLTVLFGGDSPDSAKATSGRADYEPVSVDELLEAMRFYHVVLLVDQEAGKTFHRFIQHG